MFDKVLSIVKKGKNCILNVKHLDQIKCFVAFKVQIIKKGKISSNTVNYKSTLIVILKTRITLQ